jgi:hypothetical protein
MGFMRSLCVEDLVASTAKFSENSGSANLAGHGWLPLAFSVAGKVLDGAAIGALIVNRVVRHGTQSNLRDQPPLFEGVLCQK